MAEMKNYEMKNESYAASVVYGIQDWSDYTGKPMPENATLVMLLDPEYWIARRAARYAAHALLVKAKEVGVTDEQLKALKLVADYVAYD